MAFSRQEYRSGLPFPSPVITVSVAKIGLAPINHDEKWTAVSGGAPNSAEAKLVKEKGRLSRDQSFFPRGDGEVDHVEGREAHCDMRGLSAIVECLLSYCTFTDPLCS